MKTDLILVAMPQEFDIISQALSGFKRESKGAGSGLFGSRKVEVRTTGMGPVATDRFLRTLNAEKFDRIFNFGIAGALDPRLKCGQAIRAIQLKSTWGPKTYEIAQFDEVGFSSLGLIEGAVLTSKTVLSTQIEKSPFQAENRLVDMEAYAIAEWAQGRSLFVVKVVSEEWNDGIQEFNSLIRPDGTLDQELLRRLKREKPEEMRVLRERLEKALGHLGALFKEWVQDSSCSHYCRT